MTELKAGDPAPDVTLATGDGGTLALSQMRGHAIVLYFYPKDDTPGCTTEAMDFTARKAAFEMAGAYVIGVSKDDAASHAKFTGKHAITITLASDADGSVSDAFGVWKEKSNYGRKYMGIERSTFLIDAEGRVAEIWRGVRVPGHADKVLAAAEALGHAETNPLVS
ncbi:peroxiredoxin [Sphingomonas sp.]|uniref:peroxiredoxin n=1 Tax=Sphingomonas sp. TaxID=28214 RepID=UPI003B00837C